MDKATKQAVQPVMNVTRTEVRQELNQEVLNGNIDLSESLQVLRAFDQAVKSTDIQAQSAFYNYCNRGAGEADSGIFALQDCLDFLNGGSEHA